MEDNRKKITFFLGSMRRGGAERVISILANQYIKKGWNVDIGLLLFNEVSYDIDESIHIVDLTGKTESRIRRIPFWIKRIRDYFRTEQPDVTVSFAARINIIVLIASLGLNRKVIVSERNDPKYDGRKWPTETMTKILYPQANSIVFQTERVKSYFGKRIQKKGIVIPNPVKVQTIAKEKHKKKIVTVGRLTAQKNQKLLINAYNEVLNTHPEYELWIYGDGELKLELSNLVKSLDISDKVYFPGNVSDIHQKISDAEIFVLSSDYEGLSNALLEAMMMGLPCISTNCAGSDEAIENGVNGILVDVGDKDGLTTAINRLIEDKKLAAEIAKNARSTSEKYELEGIMNLWSAAIEV